MKQITWGDEAMQRIKAGVDKLADVVGSTLGPGGSNVILERQGRIHISKDGVTVSREIDLPDPVENIGANIVKEAASRTADSAGDGTTTATVLAQAILSAGIKYITAGANRIDLKRGIDMAVAAVVNIIKKMATPIADGDIEKIAYISSNGDPEITRLITDAIGQVGRDGIIVVEDSRSTESSLVIADGSKFARGWLSHLFITDISKMECVLEFPYILVYDGVITGFKSELFDILSLLQASKGNVPVLIIAHDVQGEALSTMTYNKMKHGFSFCAVQSPDFGDTRTEVMQDLAALTGATVITKGAGLTLKNMTLDHLGTCKKVRVSQWETTVIEGSGEKLMSRINQIKTQMEEANDNALQKLKDRLARLTSKMGVLYVGGTTDIEIREKKDRIDDALQATRAALDEGVVVGGGVAYLRALVIWDSESRPTGYVIENEDQQIGTEIVRRALVVPLMVIAENVGVSGEVVLDKVKNTQGEELGYGFNAKTLQYENLITAGVLDPAKVTRLALENAASVAGMILTTKSVVSVIAPPIA